MTPRDSAYNAGQKASWNGHSRLSNPFTEKQRELQREWWAGFENAHQQQIAQNTRGVGKY